MAQKDDFFTIKEIAQSAFKGMATLTFPFEYKRIYQSEKVLDGAFFEGKFYEFKLTKRRDPIEDELAQFVGGKDGAKNALLSSYYEYVKLNYSILRIQSTVSRIFINHCGTDYEITFIAKRGMINE